MDCLVGPRLTGSAAAGRREPARPEGAGDRAAERIGLGRHRGGVCDGARFSTTAPLITTPSDALVVAALAGVAIPLALHTVGRDPAHGSSVPLTFITGAMGFFLRIEMRKAGTSASSYVLHDAVVTAFGNSNGTERVAFAFRIVEVTAGGVTTCFDLSTNTSC